MTDASSILVRGTARDDYSRISKVSVNGIAATSTDNFANWQVTVPLALAAETPLSVETEDSAANAATNVAQAMVKQADIHSAFPDAEQGFLSIEGLALDRLDGRNRLLAIGSSEENLIKAIDLTTGKRQLFADFGNAVVSDLRNLVLNKDNGRLYVSGASSPGSIIEMDLSDSSKFQIHSSELLESTSALVIARQAGDDKIAALNYVSGAMKFTTTKFESFSRIPDPVKNTDGLFSPMRQTYSMVFDADKSRYIIADGLVNSILAVDAVTGVRSLLSSNSQGSGDSFSEAGVGIVRGIALDEIRKKVIAIESKTGKVFTIDLDTGNRKLVTTVTLGSAPLKYFNDVVLDDLTGNIYVADMRLKGVISIDLVTGQQVVFSKSESHNWLPSD